GESLDKARVEVFKRGRSNKVIAVGKAGPVALLEKIEQNHPKSLSSSKDWEPCCEQYSREKFVGFDFRFEG
ncbi:1475_t:CDS:2, partial [Gigaspora rosea]